MIYEQIATGGCQSYLLGCEESRAAVVIDPELRQIDRYLGLAAREGLRLRYIIDTHTHADHFSAGRGTGRSNSRSRWSCTGKARRPFVDLRLDDGDMLIVGHMRLGRCIRPATPAIPCAWSWRTGSLPATPC